MLWHLFSPQRGVFYIVVALAIVSVTVELAYFENDLFKTASDEQSSVGGD